MKRRFAFTLVLSFAGGILLTAGLGGALGAFDRGPTDLDVSDARERGYAEATAEVDLGKEAAADEQEALGFQRGREASEWLSLDRLPNPDGWFTGVQAGRKRMEEIAAQAFEMGVEDGERLGREQALMFLRDRNVEADQSSDGSARGGAENQ